jgi:hypothetical protein
MRKPLTTQEFVEKCKLVHGAKYDYSMVEYRSAFRPITIICPKHGPFEQRATDHLHHQAGCKQCSKSPNEFLGAEEFIKRANKTHGGKYTYNNVVYTGTDNKVRITCSKHGDFLQTPSAHVNLKQGCPKCGNNCLDTEEFIRRARASHGNRYDYSLVDYRNSKTKVRMLCDKHGEFLQLPHNHIQHRTGCPKCGRNISNPEVEWLNWLNIPEQYRQKTLIIHGQKVKVDAFDPTRNVVYEFWGDFFHGNPEVFNLDDTNPKNKHTYRYLFDRTQAKREMLVNAGYVLHEIWENDWKKLKRSDEWGII